MLKARQIRALSDGMAAASLHGAWASEPMDQRLVEALGHRWGWQRDIVRRILARHEEPPNFDALAATIRSDAGFIKAVNGRARPRIVHWYPLPAEMRATYPDWKLPQFDTLDDLAERLNVSHAQLQWLADCENRRGRGDGSPSEHYRSYWLPKPTGGWRLVESPRPALKRAQRCILDELLNHVPAHPAACAYVPSRSIADYARPHVGKPLVLHLDLHNFFPSIPASRVHATLTTLGYPSQVARVASALCTTTTPRSIYRQHDGGQVYSRPHLPQGAPTSPALANLAAFRLDCRLAGAARSAGAAYTRYADDLAFSGDADFARGIEGFQRLVWRIVYEAGFELNHRKTRVMRQSVRQRLCGLVVNERLNIDRRAYDQLKAILTNCVRDGLEAQNREGHPEFREHLRGRVAHVEQIHPRRGARLRAIFEHING